MPRRSHQRCACAMHAPACALHACALCACALHACALRTCMAPFSRWQHAHGTLRLLRAQAGSYLCATLTATVRMIAYACPPTLGPG